MPTYLCGNPSCQKKVNRSSGEIEPSGNIFCSHHCSATVSNTNRARPKSICKLPTCIKLVQIFGQLYCSKACAHTGRKVDYGARRELVIDYLKNFFKLEGRIPLKTESYKWYRTARKNFGTWNNAITAAGLSPNPVMFAKRHIADDGHTCDSLSEKILDDWLTYRNIIHEVHVTYPFKNGMKSDFKIGDYWVELFGLEGQHKQYDHLKILKLRLAKNIGLKMISLSLKDIYSSEILHKKLSSILPH